MRKPGIKTKRRMSGFILLLEISLLLCAFLMIMSQINWDDFCFGGCKPSCPVGTTGSCLFTYTNGVLVSAVCTCPPVVVPPPGP